MKDFLTWKFVGIAATVVIGPLTYLVVRNIKAVWLWLDRQPAWLIRTVVLVVAFGLTALAQVAGFTLPGECAGASDGLLTENCKSALADPVFIKATLGAGMAMLLHAVKKSDPET